MAASSWANVLKTPASTDAQPPSAEAAEPSRTAVVDANAIISCLRLDRLAAALVTIPEALAEVRDRQSRQALAALPFEIQVKEPSEESLKAVLRFARETGDIYALSSTDIKLLALAHSLEVAAHGSAHLREHPVQAKAKPRSRKSVRRLPGWGQDSNAADWKAVDEAEEEEEAGGVSRIAASLQPLVFSPAAAQGAVGPSASSSAAEASPLSVELTPSANYPLALAPVDALDGSGQCAGQQLGNALPELPGAPLERAGWRVGAALPSEAEQQGAEEGKQGGDAGVSQQRPAGPSHEPARGLPREQEESAEGGEQEQDDEGDWAVARKSRNADRHRRRKEMRWQARQGAAAPIAGVRDGPAAAGRPGLGSLPGWGEAAEPASGELVGSSPAAGEAFLAVGEVVGTTSAAGEVVGPDVKATQQAAVGGEPAGQASPSDAQSEEGKEDGEGEEEEEEEDEGEEEEEEEEEETAPGGSEVGTDAPSVDELRVNTTSSVVSVTADFAMQNVLLQMGLRLVTLDGVQISRLTRWALRCHACFHMTKEQGLTKMFCPRCGNMTMERVEVSVGPDGAEFFGVRRKHCLKGTRFSLPKPKGGRAASSNPILSEDMMLVRMGKKLRRKAKAEAHDPFAPEMGTDSWFKTQQAVNGGKGTQFLMTGWKNNPNERKNARSNRRG